MDAKADEVETALTDLGLEDELNSLEVDASLFVADSSTEK